MTNHIEDDDVDSWPKDIREDYKAIKAVIDSLPIGDPLKAPAEQALTNLVTWVLRARRDEEARIAAAPRN